jgi:putative endopeptidase
MRWHATAMTGIERPASGYLLTPQETRMTHCQRLAIALGLVALLPLGSQAGADADPATPAATASGIQIQYLDDSVRPQDDFYRHVVGKWAAELQIPPDKPSYGTFDQLADAAQDKLHAILEAAAADTGAAADSETRKIGDLYASFLDEARIETLGIGPLARELAAIDELRDRDQLIAEFAHLEQIGVTVPLATSVQLDDRNSTRYAFVVTQDGLGMPDRDYYLKTDDANLKAIREKYREHIQRTLTLSGDADAQREATQILALETALARPQWTKVQNRDPVKTYNLIPVAKLASLAPRYDWRRYLTAAGVSGKTDALIVNQPSYVRDFDRILTSTPLAVWRIYLRWQLLSAYSPYLPKAYVDEHFAFAGTTLEGTPENRSRWRRGVSLVDAMIGEALGRAYAERNFPAASKERAVALIGTLLETYRRDLEDLDWMGPDTRTEAQRKLSSMATKIGYPDHWRDYSRLEIRRDDLIGNIERAEEFEYQRNVAKLGRPVDRTEWGMTPQTVNAYYDPKLNEIVVPAAILQPPLFDPAVDDAVNYGATGAIVGHELSHAFDDEGSQYDSEGNLRNWWTPADHKAFAAKTQRLVAEYSAFEPLAGYHLNGELTLGENIADNSGLAIAYRAYHFALRGRNASVLDGLTGDQRFYIGFAQLWREKDREPYIIEMVKTDPHSIPEFRVQGSVVNQPGFYQAFTVKPGDRMYVAPDRRVIIW